MATHSSVLAWRIPGSAEPGGLPSMGSHRVGHDWSDLAAVAAAQDYRANECTAWIFFPLELVFQLEYGFSSLVVQHWNHLGN